MKRKQVIFFIYYSSYRYSTPLRSSIQCWLKRGYEVVLFQSKDNNLCFSNTNTKFKICQISVPVVIHYFLRLTIKAFQIFDHVGLKAIGSIGFEVEYLIKSLYFSLVCALINVNTRNSICIGCDPQGLLSAWIVSSLKKNKLIYWSFELWIKKDIKSLSKKLIKKIEKVCNKSALLTIDFGDQRCRILKNENNLDSHKMFSIPNSPLGKPCLKRNNFFNEKFNIPSNKHILLYAGGVGEVYGLEKLLRNLNKIPNSCVVVIHCRSYDKNLEKLKNIGKRYINNKVFFFD